jgi:hypothetical protein
MHMVVKDRHLWACTEEQEPLSRSGRLSFGDELPEFVHLKLPRWTAGGLLGLMLVNCSQFILAECGHTGLIAPTNHPGRHWTFDVC